MQDRSGHFGGDGGGVGNEKGYLRLLSETRLELLRFSEVPSLESERNGNLKIGDNPTKHNVRPESPRPPSVMPGGLEGDMHLPSLPSAHIHTKVAK